MSSKTLTPRAEAYLATMIERAEARRVMLEELGAIGMAMSREIATRWIDGPYHPEPRNDPARAFAAVSRSVRLTLAQQVRIDTQVLAWCNGEVACDAPMARRVRVGGTPTDQEDRAQPHADAADRDYESLIEHDPIEGSDFPPSPEVGTADLRRPAASRVGETRADGSLDAGPSERPNTPAPHTSPAPHPAPALTAGVALSTSGEGGSSVSAYFGAARAPP